MTTVTDEEEINALFSVRDASAQTVAPLRHTYHYYAETQGRTALTTIDGILRCIEPIDRMARYEEVKRSIAEQQNLGDGDGLSIKSLSYLGLHE